MTTLTYSEENTALRAADPAYRLANVLVSKYREYVVTERDAVNRGVDIGKSAAVRAARSVFLGVAAATGALTDLTETWWVMKVMALAGQPVQVPSPHDPSGSMHWFVTSSKALAAVISQEF